MDAGNAAIAMDQRQLSVGDLTFAGFAAQLADPFDQMKESAGQARMAAGQ